MSYIPVALRTQVIDRAFHSCEYCLIHVDYTTLVHEIDHVIAEKHGGETTLDNLAYACAQCNRNKGSDIASVDPETNQPQFIYNPRRQRWEEHFQLEGALIVPHTSVGRASVRLLQLNHVDRLLLRKELITIARYPYHRGLKQ